LLQRLSKNGCCTHCGNNTASRPSGQSQGRMGAAMRATISIKAMPCNTPKLMYVCGNMVQEPMLTSTAQPATRAQRRQKRGQPGPWCNANAWPTPAQNRNKLTMQMRWRSQNGSVLKRWWMKPKWFRSKQK
jgi:hypothetical protein